MDIVKQTEQAQDSRSGTAAVVARARVNDDPLDVSEHEALVRTSEAGAVVSFAGVVRDHDGGRAVCLLEYSAYPAAASTLARIACEVAAQTGVRRVAVSHRIGRLEVGDIALACAVSADHRRSAFEACAALVEQIKARLPVWKFQIFQEGPAEWVGSPVRAAGAAEARIADDGC